MLNDSQLEFLTRSLRPMQIIVGALATGVFIFTGVSTLFPQQPGNDGQQQSLLYVYLGMGFAVLAVLGSIAIPQIISSRMRQDIADGNTASFQSSMPSSTEVGDVRHLASMYQTRLIIGAAILEGAAFFNVIAYIFERQRISLGIAALLGIIVLSQIPMLSRLRSWAESDLVAIKQLRSMGSQNGR